MQNREVVSNIQSIYLISLFIISETFALARAVEAKNDFWLSIILAIAITVPFMLIFARLHILFPQKDLFDINENIFGRFLGKLLNFALIAYVAFNFMSVLNVFTQFIVTVSFPQTSRAVLTYIFILLCIWMVREGLEVMGRWAALFTPIIFAMIFLTVFALIPEMQVAHILPILHNGAEPVIIGSLATVLFPLSETVVFPMLLSLDQHHTPYRIYLLGLLVGGFVMLVLLFSQVLVVGIEAYTTYFFPGHLMSTRINIGTILQRIEIVSSASYLLGGFIKISILLLAVTKGFTKVFNISEYRFIVTPMALLIGIFSYVTYPSSIRMLQWAEDVWGYFAAPFQIFIPIMIYVAAEIKCYPARHGTAKK